MSVVRSSEVPLLGGSKCTSSMGKSIGGVRFVRCKEVVRFSESPLLEVLLYYKFKFRWYALYIRIYIL